MINRNLSQIILATCSSILLLSSCIKEEIDPCASYIRFVYNYNMSYVDLFPQQATKMNLYIFDENNIFVTELKDESGSFSKDYVIPLPANLGNKNYTFMAWSGLYNDSYDKTTLSPGQSTLEDFELKVNGLQTKSTGNGIINRELKPLWHGKLSNVSLEQNNYVKTVSLMKNTNKFRIIMQVLDDKATIDVNDYDFQISSANGTYNHNNELQGDEIEDKIDYKPYHTKNDTETGALAELNTLRLMSDKNNRLVISHKKTGNIILDIPLNKYLNALKLEQYADIPLQEYMDREDQYGIIFFFKNLNPDNGNYLSVNIQINGWYIREQDISE